ncbi:hypothetical protein [Streptomyces sp. NRRL F-5135]|uniref:hypothetical protein n=1 Tax=Streptomyces sp. NRRL F-5135 TaxID=1463858 RepID=UPI0004C597F4|nr:hypothetical protein [Streptomyces sp. NRRL F-5135]
MTNRTAQHWTESLFDSVYALYEAAREYQSALQAAVLAGQGVDYARRQVHEGRIILADRTNAFGRPARRKPHEQALFKLSRVYSEHESAMRRGYEDAAMLFATGTVWAVHTVQEGGTPAWVEFPSDDQGQPVLRSSGTTIHTALAEARYAGAPEVAAAHDRLSRLLAADEVAEEIAGRPDHEVTERDANDMFEAIDAAKGIGDAAFAYGLAAQRALNFALLGPRRERERALARARAEAGQPAG